MYRLLAAIPVLCLASILGAYGASIVTPIRLSNLDLVFPKTLPGLNRIRVASVVRISPAVWPTIRNIHADAHNCK